jgi:hypothetical protein
VDINFNPLFNANTLGATHTCDAVSLASVPGCPLEAMQDSWETQELHDATRRRASAQARRARAVKPWQTLVRG